LFKRYTRTDFKINTETASDSNIIPVLDKRQDYRRYWIQHINRMPRNRLPRIIKPTEQKAEETSRVDYGDFWMCESGTGKHVAQLHVSYMMIIITIVIIIVYAGI